MINVDIKSNEAGVNPDAWFENVFDDSLLLTDFSRRVLKDVAKCKVVSENLVISDVLGPISPSMIGSGVKAVLYLMYGGSKFLNSYWMGDNLIPFIQEVSKYKDVNLRLGSLMPLCDDSDYSVEVKIVQTGEIYKRNLDLYNAILDEGIGD